MSEILAEYMKLVPRVEATGHHQLPNGSTIDYDDTRFHEILFGGDQLTVAHIRAWYTSTKGHSREAGGSF